MILKTFKNAEGKTATFAFIAETEEEKLALGTLRNAYFHGLEERGTYPHYDGITSEDNYVTSMRFGIPAKIPNGMSAYPWKEEDFVAFNDMVSDEIHETINEIKNR